MPRWPTSGKPTGAIDSIRAEDIAKFPDSNLAESLQRVPGVSITRDAGEGRNISVRGLGAQFTRVRINGMEAMSTTGGTDSSGGTNRNRQFDFNVFASELFSNLTVRKTASADVDEGSLGATVDLRTARPFDFKEFTMVGGLKAAYNDLQGDVDPRATFLVSDTFADGKFGVLFSAAYAERSLIEEGQSTVRWDLGSSVGGFNAAVQRPPDVTHGAGQRRIPSAHPALRPPHARPGSPGPHHLAPVAAQRRRTSFNLDVLYSDFKAKRDENFLEAFSFSRTAAQGGKPQTAGARWRDRRQRHAGLRPVRRRGHPLRVAPRRARDQVLLGRAVRRARVQRQWSLDELVGYSRSDFNNPIQTTITLDRSNSDGYSYDYRDSSRLPAFNYNFDVTDAANWSFGNLRRRLLVRDPPASAGRRQHLPGGQGRSEVRADRQPGSSSSASTTRSTTSSPGSSAAPRKPPCRALPAGTTLASMTELLTGFGDGLNMPAGTPTDLADPEPERLRRHLRHLLQLRHVRARRHQRSPRRAATTATSKRKTRASICRPTSRWTGASRCAATSACAT